MTYLVGTLKFKLLRVHNGNLINQRFLSDLLSLKGLSPDAVPSLMVCIRSPGLDMDGDRDIGHVSHRTCFSGSVYVV